jgi:phosphate transport system permease protein
MENVQNTSIATISTGLERRRMLKDKLANIVIVAGGMFVIVAIALIFFYLLYEVWPIFKSAEFEHSRSYAVTVPATFTDVDEYDQTGMRLLPDGSMQFFRVGTGEAMGTQSFNIPAGVKVVTVQRAGILSGVVGMGLSNGQIIAFKPHFGVEYGDHNQRTVTPQVDFPYGDQPLTLDDSGAPVQNFALRDNDEQLQVLGLAGGKLSWATFAQKKADAPAGGLSDDSPGLSDDSSSTVATTKVYQRSSIVPLPLNATDVHSIVIGQDGRWAYVFHGRNDVAIFRPLAESGPELYQQTKVEDADAAVTAVAALQGNISLLIGDSTGTVSQWFMVRDPHSEVDKFSFTHIRSFKLGSSPVTAIEPEIKRKGFVAGDKAGNVGYFFTTSERTLSIANAGQGPILNLDVSPRSDGVIVQSEKGSSFWSLHIDHPDISWSSTWGKVWYESYSEPGYTWQSTSGNPDFEGKLSLVPLAFGTLKAAFWAMILATPLAICGAMYTAVFMAPGLRRKVKPAIELMQALPTVILGFLAGLWLAPAIEINLPGIFSLLLVTPIIIILFGYCWSQIPREKRAWLDGYAPLLLIAPILIGGIVSFELSRPIEIAFFGGDVRQWMSDAVGLKFDQRNALIVGLAMGFAVIAPIFSIAEDALFAVPRHLTNGSLALGATQWQTLIRVVLPTASPGIFSAVMIGFGRAVGETMIVLMATGNTAVMNWNIFEGMRTLSANVAVEMGEAEVGSTHFRVLFLSALVLFVLTFILNTLAEVVRSRLRKKYGSL